MDKGNFEFDKFIREKVSDIEFSGEKDSWELVKYLLKQKAKARQRARLLKFFVSFLAMISTGLLLWLMPLHEKTPAQVSDTNYQNIKVPQPPGNIVPAGAQLKKENKENSKDNPENNSLFLHSEESKEVAPPVKRDIPENTEEANASGKSLDRTNMVVTTEKDSSEYDFFSAMNSYTWGSDSFKIEITNVGKGVNSPYSDFAPVISADGSTMLFTSRRPVTEKEIKQHKQVMEHVYSCSLNSKKNKWSNTYILTGAINVEGRNNSAIGLSNDGQLMLLYRDDIHGNGDIYESVLKGTEWTDPVMLPEPVNTKYHESSASISPDGKTLYFVSDRPGGIGGRDIWFCTRDANGKWSNATNLGRPVNTPQDEEGIFIHPDGKTMYFSSKGHDGLGGYDVYRTVHQPDGSWSSPVNLGAPLNTPGDDVYFVLEANGTTGYYTSSRPGGNGEKDIYKVTFRWLEEKHITPNLVLVKGVIKDDNDKPFEASIEIIDNEKNEVVTKLSSNSATGKYLVSLPAGKNYGIRVNAKDYLFHSENFIVPESSAYSEVEKDIVLNKIEVGKTIVLKNIFYDFDKATLRKESVSELERLIALMNEYPSLKIELSSHTDSKGTEDYNQVLSQARAQSVVDYLINKNISKDRLVAKGYGESRPVAPNENSDGSDNPEGRQMNRRTEFKILSF